MVRATLALIIGILLLGGSALANTSDGETPAQEDVCSELTGASYGLCNAYCEAMDCDSSEPHASEKACARVEANFQNKTGELPPCVITDPCADLAAVAECPCNYNIVPKDINIWEYDSIASSCNEVIFTNTGFNNNSEDCLLIGACYYSFWKGQLPGIRSLSGSNPLCSYGYTTDGNSLEGSDFVYTNSDEALTCNCRLEQYTKKLIQQGTSVKDLLGNSLSTEDISCNPQ